MARGNRPQPPAELQTTLTDAHGLSWELWWWPETDTGWRTVKLVAVTSSGGRGHRKAGANYRLGWHSLACRWADGKILARAQRNVPELLVKVEELFS